MWGYIKRKVRSVVRRVRKVVRRVVRRAVRIFRKIRRGIKAAIRYVRNFFRGVVNFIRGLVSSLWNGIKWLIHWFLGQPEYWASYFGWMPEKKLKVKIIILMDADKQPIASRRDVDTVLALAKEVFKEQVNVRIVSPSGPDELIVGMHPEPAPNYVLNPLCGGGGFWQVYTKVGAWFRKYSAWTHAGSYLGYGMPATIFIVKDVQNDKSGCFLAAVTNYGFIDSGYLSGSEGRLLGLAHELGHACDLLTHNDRTLMESGPGTRSRKLTRRQRARFRASARVTYR
jgi:hypothetical protein